MKKIKGIYKGKIVFCMILIVSCWFSIAASGTAVNRWVPLDDDPQQSLQVSSPGLEVIQADEGNLTILVKTNGFFADEQKEYDRVFTSLRMGKYNSDMKPGYPHLPVIRQYIEIPAGKTAHLEVIPGPAVTFNNYTISPVPQPGVGVKNAVERFFYCDERVYNADCLFPSRSAYLDKSERLRGHDIALLHICPFQYNPAQKILYAYPNMKVRVTFEGETQPVNSRVRSSQFDSFLRGVVLNAGAVDKNPLAKVNVMGEDVAFLIITAPEFLAAANVLHDHKESLGINTVVKTTNDTGITGIAIKNYIRNAYETWTPAPTYVLLLGDAVYIPAHYLTEEPGYDYDQIGTDLYYACVDGPDYQPDIFLGRISVDTLAEAQTVVQKIINYETNPPALARFYADAAVVTYFQDYNYDGYEDYRSVRTCEEIKDFLATRGYNTGRIYSARDNSPYPTHYNSNGYYGNGEPLPGDLLTTNGFNWDGRTEDIISAFNSGVSLMILQYNNMEPLPGSMAFVEGDVGVLNNGELLPVVFHINSESGNFAAETGDYYIPLAESCCESLLRKQGGGAVAAIGASQICYKGYSDFMVEGFIDSIWPDFLPSVPNPDNGPTRLGPMLNHGKIAMDILWGDPLGFRRVEYETFNLLGDPTLNVWTRQPATSGTQSIKIQSDPELCALIEINQADINGNAGGTTTFSRTYPHGTVITLTAPTTFYGSNFVKWVVDGAIMADPVIQLTMDQYHLVTAFYTDQKILKVTSLPFKSNPITVAPADNNGKANGNTNFNRYYTVGTTVTLTAPAGFNGRPFVRWLIDGVPDENRTIQVIMDSDHTVVAEFSILSSDKKILLIDKDFGTSAPKIKTAIEANGFATEYMAAIPAGLNPQLYPAVFFSGEVLTSSESAQFSRYLDNGGNLYIESCSDLDDVSQEFLKNRLGIERVLYLDEITSLIGMPGTFTEGFNFTFPSDTFYANGLQWADEVTGSFVIWDYTYYSSVYQTGIAHDAKNFKTISVGFNFGALPQNQQITVMGKYLNFFMLNHAAEPKLQVISPNGGENLIPGAIHNISWNSTNVYTPLKITLWKDGFPVGVIADRVEPGRGYYPWQTGTYNGGTAAPGAGYIIKIEGIGAGVNDLSNAPFTISNTASLNVTSPNRGGNLKTGTPHTITWVSTNVNGTLKITLWNNSTQVGIIADSLNPSPGTYAWTVGNYQGGTASPGTGYKIKIEENGTAISDMSDSPFSIISSPTITLTSPNTGGTLLTGVALPVTWNANNVSGTLKISLWKDGAPVGIIAQDLEPYKRNYSWTVGAYMDGMAEPGTGYKIKIEDNESGVSDDSDVSFSLGEPPSLIIVSPNGGNNLSLGTAHRITWKSSNISGTLKITLLKSDVFVGVIADNINPVETSYPWTVGNYDGGTASPAKDYKIKIEENGTSAADTGDNSFSITPASTITVVSPNGGENLTIGKTQQITWNAANIKGILKITLWKDADYIGIIADNVDQARGSFLWTVGNYAGGTAPAGTGYRVKIEDDGTPFSDMSDTSFTLWAPPSLTITSPNGGETLITDTSHLITWTSVNISGTLKITLWDNNQLSGIIADNINPLDTSYLWNIDSYSSGISYKVKIEENGTTVSDISDENFSISNASSISGIRIYYTPVTNNYFIAQLYDINWNSTNLKRPVKITLWKDSILVGTIADYLDPKIKDYNWKMGTYAGGTVGPGTGYQIKIEEHDTDIFSIGSPFTILPVPTIFVTSPEGGEILTRGTTFNITWEATDAPWNLDITLFKGDYNIGEIAFNVNPGDNSYQWTVGNLQNGSLTEGNNYQIEINVAGTKFAARSNTFGIYFPPSLTVTKPDGDDVWGLNDVKEITWDAHRISGTLKLSLWKEDQLIGIIADDINPEDDSYSWVVGSYPGGNASPGTGYQIKIEENGSTVSGMSNPFPIGPAHTIRILSPNGGENYPSGSTQTITWTSSNITEYLRISLLRDDSETFIGYAEPGETSFQWFVDEQIGEGYKIKIKEDFTAYSDMSDNWFSITGAYSLRVTAPNGDEQWDINTVKQITWTTSGLSGTVNIYIEKDGANKEKIAQDVNVTTGYYNWTVGSLYYGGTVSPGTGYKIKIETNQQPYIYDKSNNTFTITGI